MRLLALVSVIEIQQDSNILIGNEVTIFLIALVLLFLLGFDFDYLEFIHIVAPSIGPVIYGGTFDPVWVTIMIAINLQTSFLRQPTALRCSNCKGWRRRAC